MTSSPQPTKQPFSRITFLIGPDGNAGFGIMPALFFSQQNYPKSRLQVSNGDIYIESATNGVIMKSPNGQCWRLTVSDTGTPVFSSITCP
ncbi:MAG: hypothetical protein IPL35_07725 [Sphingobacteriales bacterium]|nr:hypothetical protein [Sphingobacteriales bacterium]